VQSLQHHKRPPSDPRFRPRYAREDRQPDAENVPGPTKPLTVAGSRLKQWLSWVPQSGDIGMGVSIFSYAGEVQFGLITDAALIPDPEALVSRFPEEFEKYLYCILLDSPPAAQEEKSTPPRRSAPEIERGNGARRSARSYHANSCAVGLRMVIRGRQPDCDHNHSITRRHMLNRW